MELISVMIMGFGVLIVTIHQMLRNTLMPHNAPAMTQKKVWNSQEMSAPIHGIQLFNKTAPILPMKKNVLKKEIITSIATFPKLALTVTRYVMELFIV